MNRKSLFTSLLSFLNLVEALLNLLPRFREIGESLQNFGSVFRVFLGDLWLKRVALLFPPCQLGTQSHGTLHKEN